MVVVVVFFDEEEVPLLVGVEVELTTGWVSVQGHSVMVRVSEAVAV